MNLHSETPAGLRRAALALHALGQADRDWLLEQLPPQPRQTLGGLLAELTELGIAPDVEVIRAALSEKPPEPSLSAHEARALCLVLSEEAPAVRSLLLAALSAPEREVVLQHWPHELVARPTAVAGPGWAPALHTAVMQSWRKLAQLPEAAT